MVADCDIHLCAVIVNRCRPERTIDCLRSLERVIGRAPERRAVVVDNASPDGAADRIEEEIRREGWGAWAKVVRSTVHDGFAASANAGIAAETAEVYLLLDRDTRVLPGAIDRLAAAFEAHHGVGIVGPCMERPEGRPRPSCFRNLSPLGDLLEAARAEWLHRLLPGMEMSMGVPVAAVEVGWVSFRCAAIRREVIERIGLLDDGYFMHFEDADYARRARKAGWTVLYEPAARVVHPRAGRTPLEHARRTGQRVPAHYCAARNRYLAKFYGGVLGVLMANLLWLAGRLGAVVRDKLHRAKSRACPREWRDRWTNWLRPLRAPTYSDWG